MPPSRASWIRTRRCRHGIGESRALIVGVAVLLTLSGVFLEGTARAAVAGAAPLPAQGSTSSLSEVPSAGSTASPNSGSALPRAPALATSDLSNVPCYSLNATICISVTNSSVPNVVPLSGSHVSSVEPPANTTLTFWIRSATNLIWPGNVSTSGPRTPIQLNATAVLWNGVPYYSGADGTVWHPVGTDWWTYGPVGVNKTYPYYYGVSMAAKTLSGVPEWFPGMTVTWWVYFVQNTSGVFSHWSSVPFQFTFQGAWPASPYPGDPQYAGSAAATEDLALSQDPSTPNFNDSVAVTVVTTPLDLVTSATLGGGYLDLLETAPDGAVLNSTTFPFSVSVHASVGAVAYTVSIPASLARSPGALVQYRVTAWDTSQWAAGQAGPDQIVSSWSNYTVNGNGSFRNGDFAQDLSVSTVPTGPGLSSGLPATVPPGTPVTLTLASTYASTAIESAEIELVLNDPAINATVQETLSLERDNSTHFTGVIPAVPLGGLVHYRVVAWDFLQDREVSGLFAYQSETLAQEFPSPPLNSTFFEVYVYDNGTGSWVTGANVGITQLGGQGFVHLTAQTFGGEAYPNETGEAFVPALLTANASYQIEVTDPSFVPVVGSSAPTVSVELEMPHNPARSGVVEVGSDYVVEESGPAIYFWLNQTVGGATYSPSVDSGLLLSWFGALGLLGFAVAAIPLAAWWLRIRRSRAEQEKRVTL